MEVDDAIVTAEPAEEKTVLDDGDGAEDNEEIEEDMPTASTSSKQKRAKLKHDKEEPHGTLESQNNDSVLTATPFKLEVSCSEDEREEEGDSALKAAIRRKLLSTPMEEDTAAKDGLEELEEVAIKRKRYEVRRSGSEECLLGFDELSGEAELVKAEVAEEPLAPVEDQPMAPAEEPLENLKGAVDILDTAEETKESPLNSPKTSKKVNTN